MLADLLGLLQNRVILGDPTHCFACLLIVADDLGAAKLSRSTAFTQLRVVLVHLFGTQAWVGVDEGASGIRVWRTVVLVIIVFEDGSARLGYVWEEGHLIPDLAVVAGSDVEPGGLVDVGSGASAALARWQVVVHAADQAATPFVVLSVYWEMILMLSVEIFWLRRLWVKVLLLLCRIESSAFVGKNGSSLRRVCVVVKMSVVALRVVQLLLGVRLPISL